MCAKCEGEQAHPDHPLIKMREPCALPQFKPIDKDGNDLDVMLDAKLVNSSIPDEFEVCPGQDFSKEWTFKNNGAWQWPAGAQLMLTEGDKFMIEQGVVEESVKPDELCQIVTKFRAP